ncbi:MarR family winged helix-turn-helix transcriptional regulator [Rhizocola hellebori]|uniref:MarR family winged helix-turn-helix transcriptional regulator n=1 Tax=Rhizocola hellebori TaxID=1392758 RepID=UPI001944882E|nr:MarR family transcriptional regulator [Rhizocola hellebori]
MSQLPPPPQGVPRDARHRTANVLHSAALRLLRRAARADVGMDLDGPRASLLAVLVFGGPQTMSRLANQERVTPAAITKLVAALEESGLAKRSRDDTDRRLVHVEATEAGRLLLEQGRADRVRAVAALLKGLSQDDLDTLRRAADIIASRL